MDSKRFGLYQKGEHIEWIACVDQMRGWAVRDTEPLHKRRADDHHGVRWVIMAMFCVFVICGHF